MKSRDVFFQYRTGEVWTPAVSFKRTAALPIDYYSTFQTLSEAVEYARLNAVSYPSQLVTVVNADGSNDLYITNQSTGTTSTDPSYYLTKIDFSGNTQFTTLALAQAYLTNPFCKVGSTISVTNDSDSDNNGLYVVLEVSSAKTLVKVGSGGGNADAPIVHRVTNNSPTLSLPSSGDDYLLLPNNSYIYEVALSSLSLDLSGITGGTTNTDNFSGYSCVVYFQTGANMTSFTVTHNNASYTFGDYSVSSGTYTFNVSPSTSYIFTIKDNVVTLGPGAEEIILSALEAIRESVGLEPDYTYVNKPDPYVIVGATDIKDAIFLLDDAVGDVIDDIDTMEGTILSMGTDITTIQNTILSMGTDISTMESAISSMSTDITDIYGTLTDLSDNKEDKATVVYDTTHNGTYSFTIASNTSYIFANATGFTSLSVDLTNVTGTPTSGTTHFANIAYEEDVYFKATSNTTTLTVSNCNATCVFGQYTVSGNTYTFNSFTAGQWYCLSIRDNSVACGPIEESQLSLVSSSDAGNYLVTGLSVDGHTITYKHTDFSSTDTTRYLRHDGTWQTISAVSGVWGTCSTAAGTAAKTVDMTGFTLQTGVVANITFSNTNTTASPTLNIGGTGAKSIYYNGAALTTYNDFEKGGLAGVTITYVYDGTNWVWLSNSVDTSRELCTFAGATDATKGFALSGTSPNQTLTVTMYPNKTYYIGEYTSTITTLVLDVTNVLQSNSVHTPINYESIAHFYNGYTVRIKTGDTTVDAENFSPSVHYGSYADLPVNQVCFLSVTDNIATFGPTVRDTSSTDGYVYPYTLPTATSSTLGGVMTGYTQNLTQNQYSIGISSGKIYATVPLAGLGTRGTMIYPNLGAGYTPIASPSSWTVATNGNVYPIEKTTTNEAFVRVPGGNGSGGYGQGNYNYMLDLSDTSTIDTNLSQFFAFMPFYATILLDTNIDYTRYESDLYSAYANAGIENSHLSWLILGNGGESIGVDFVMDFIQCLFNEHTLEFYGNLESANTPIKVDLFMGSENYFENVYIIITSYSV